MFLRLEINEKTKKKTIQNWLHREGFFGIEEEIAYHEIDKASHNRLIPRRRRREKVNSSVLNLRRRTIEIREFSGKPNQTGTGGYFGLV